MDIALHRQQMLANLDRTTLKAGLILSEAVDEDTNAMWFKDHGNLLKWVRHLGHAYDITPEGMMKAMTNLIEQGYYDVYPAPRKGILLSRTFPGVK